METTTVTYESIMNFRVNQRVEFGPFIGVVTSISVKTRTVSFYTHMGIKSCPAFKVRILDEQRKTGRWSDAEVAFVVTNPDMSPVYMARILNRSFSSLNWFKSTLKQIA